MPDERLCLNKKAGACAGLLRQIRTAAVSAGRFAAARDADLLLEAVEADGADHDLLADDVARRAAEAHVLGELEVLLDGRLDLGAGEILIDLRGVEAGLFGRRHGARLVGRSPAAEQLLVEVEIFL